MPSVPSKWIVVNKHSFIVRLGVNCDDVLENQFFAAASLKTSRMSPSFYKTAFGDLSQGGVAPDGWCWICGSTKDILTFELEGLLNKGMRAHPVCKNCRENKDGKFRIVARKKTSFVLPKFKIGDHVMGEFSSGGNTNFHPAKIVSTISHLGTLAFKIRFFDSRSSEDTHSRYLNQIRPFVKKGDLVMVDWRSGEPYKARITMIHIPAEGVPTGADSPVILPKILVDVKFESDGKILNKKSITTIKIPLVKEGEPFVKAKVKRKRATKKASTGRSTKKRKTS